MGQFDVPVNMKPRSKRRFQNLNLRLTFTENYVLTETLLGSGSYGEVRICKSRSDNQNEEGKEFAVKIVKESSVFFSRVRVLREIETFYICREHENIIQFLHFYEEPLGFYLVFEKIEGGPLFDHIRNRNYLNEAEASQIVLELAKWFGIRTIFWFCIDMEVWKSALIRDQPSLLYTKPSPTSKTQLRHH
uniref:Protein kinase domain-containing protein n=1 Tax=Lepeophtheirus salmonis TaxID=72036 RepID=A0A0K2SWE4_LEPSM